MIYAPEGDKKYPNRDRFDEESEKRYGIKPVEKVSKPRIRIAPEID